MNAVSFRNTGLIDLRSVRTFGVSAKENENPIGFFGTGLKYAIAICLRLGCQVTMWRGLERFDFSTSEVAIRNGEFRIVTMNGEEIGFTTDLGKTWEPWQAYREIHCNTTDERGDILDGPVLDAITRVLEDGDFAGLNALRASLKQQHGITFMRNKRSKKSRAAAAAAEETAEPEADGVEGDDEEAACA